MKKLAMMGLVVGALVPGAANADQCAYVTQAQAEDAKALLDVGATVVEFCEPCGEQPMSVQVTSVTTAETGFENTWEVSVNGAGIDLAYTFVANGDGKWVNLSKMVDCPSDGVSCLLDDKLAPLAGDGGCETAGDKEDGIASDNAGGGCQIGGASQGGGGLLLGLGLLGFALVYRRRRA